MTMITDEEMGEKVANELIKLDADLARKGFNRTMMADAMVVAVVGIAVDLRGPRETVAELRKLADSLEEAAPEMERALDRAGRRPRAYGPN